MTRQEKSGQQTGDGMQVPGTRMARGWAPWKSGTEPAITKSPGLPSSPLSLPLLPQSVPATFLSRPSTTAYNLFSPASSSLLLLLSYQFSVMLKSFPASKQTTKQTNFTSLQLLPYHFSFPSLPDFSISFSTQASLADTLQSPLSPFTPNHQ